MKLSKEQIDVAVEWWQRAIERPKFDTLGPTRGRDREETYSAGFAEAVATVLASQHGVTDASVEKFGAALRKQLEAFNDEIHCLNRNAQLYADYDPFGMLREAFIESGVDTSRCPWKTCMWFDEDGGVTVRSGYAAAEEKLL